MLWAVGLSHEFQVERYIGDKQMIKEQKRVHVLIFYLVLEFRHEDSAMLHSQRFNGRVRPKDSQKVYLTS